MKKVVSLFLCLAMLFSMLVTTTMAAGGSSNVIVETDPDTVEAGGTFTVTIENTDMTVASIACGIFFDTKKVKCVSIVGSDPDDPNWFAIYKSGGKKYSEASAKPSVDGSNTTGTVGFTWIGTSETSYIAGTIATVTFEVDAAATGSVDILVYETSDGTDGINLGNKYNTYEEAKNDATLGKRTVTITKPDVPVTGVSFNEGSKNLSLKTGDEHQLEWTVEPAEADATDVTISVTEGDAVTVDANGLVTAVKAGTATITITAGDFSDTCTVTVECAAHDYNQEKVDAKFLKSEANCTSPAVYYKSCVCGAFDNSESAKTFTNGEKDLSNHTESAVWVSTDPDKHWKEYPCCDAVDATTRADHSFQGGHCECGAVCGTTFDHNYTVENPTQDALKSEANCTSAAVYYKSCACSAIATADEHTFSYGVALGHDYTEQLTDAAHLKDEATKCTEYNTYWYDCSRCAANAKDDINATDKFWTSNIAGPHVYTQAHEDAAHLKHAATNCTEKNTYWYDCEYCDANAKDDGNATDKWYISDIAGDHSFTEQIADDAHLVPGTGVNCQSAKQYYYDCEYCDTKSAIDIWTSQTMGDHVYDMTQWGYSTKEEGHAHKCLYCDAHDDLQPHVPGPAATENDDQICTECKIVLTPSLGHIHANHMTPVSAEPATCTADGHEAYSACSCGMYFKAADGKEFTDLAAWKEGEGKIPALGHDYTEQIADPAHLKTAATNCTEFNVYWYDCSRCVANAKDDNTATDKYWTSTIEGPHVFTEQIADDAHFVAGSGTNCQSAKQYYYDCEYCDAKSTTDIWTSQTMGDHKYTEQIADDAHLVSGTGANCKDAKEYYYDCAHCDDMSRTLTWESTVMGPHNFVEDPEKKHVASVGTCMSEAVYYKVCSVCGVPSDAETFVGEKDENNHKWKATYSTDGEKHWIECERNAAHVKEKNDHDKNAYAWDATNHWAKCSVCGYEFTTVKTAHKDDTGDYKCDTCGYQMSRPGGGYVHYYHWDYNGDGRCDFCGMQTNCKHTDVNGDGKCDSCSAAVKVQSSQTFDAGILMYAGMAVLAATGSAAMIGKKRKEQ